MALVNCELVCLAGRRPDTPVLLGWSRVSRGDRAEGRAENVFFRVFSTRQVVAGHFPRLVRASTAAGQADADGPGFTGVGAWEHLSLTAWEAPDEAEGWIE
jgi:hypothetical protein